MTAGIFCLILPGDKMSAPVSRFRVFEEIFPANRNFARTGSEVTLLPASYTRIVRAGRHRRLGVQGNIFSETGLGGCPPGLICDKVVLG